MFTQARIRLTLWYVLVIGVISVLFSLAFYDASTRELRRLVERIEFMQEHEDEMEPAPMRGRRGLKPPSLEELQESNSRLIWRLVLINGVILLGTAGGGYWLAGRTLSPIAKMVEDQHVFVSNASHELRTPIATMRAEMEGVLLEKKLSVPSLRRVVESSLEELGRLQSLSEELLALARLRSGKAELEVVAVDAVVHEAVRRVKPLAEKKEIELVVGGVDVTVKGVATELREVLVILLDNAIKYSNEHGTVWVDVEHRGDVVVVRVKDEGVGIAKVDLDHVFERFYQGDEARSNHKGFGLGLAIAKETVERCAGRIRVSSDEGEGSVFEVELEAA